MSDIKKISIDDVKEITLLTIEQAERLTSKQLERDYWWWLRSPGSFQDPAACVFNDGSIYYSGICVSFDDVCVRPVFIIPNLNLKIGDKIQVENCMCTIIEENLAFAENGVCKHFFDYETNNWETSELKRYIESEDFKNLLKK